MDETLHTVSAYKLLGRWSWEGGMLMLLIVVTSLKWENDNST